MYQVEAVYLDGQKESITFNRKPQVDVKGSNVVFECSSGQKFVLNIHTFMFVRILHPAPTTDKPFKFSTNLRFNTKSADVDLLMHVSEPKVEVKVHGNASNVIFISESDCLLRVINGEWLESAKIDFYVPPVVDDVPEVYSAKKGKSNSQK